MAENREEKKSGAEDLREAMHFVNEVRYAFKEDEEKYRMFLDILGNYRAGRTAVDEVKTQLIELFGKRQELILGFNAFLPKGSEIITDDKVKKRSRIIEFEGVRSFMNKLKERVQDDDLYTSFLDALYVYMIQHKDITKVQLEVGALLEGHPDLVEEFTRISSDYVATTTAKTLSDQKADKMLFTKVVNEFQESRRKEYP